jgi:hypothetical protein
MLPKRAMGKKVFISYSHRQGDWVWNRLRPCLGAGGAEVVIDRERFQAGRTVGGQMDAEQDAADLSVAVLSTDYVRSELCLHELDRAAARDPRFECGLLVPVVREDCTLPPVLAGAGGPLWIDLRDDGRPEPWGQLFRACGGDLGCSAVDWLRARDQLLRLLNRRDSSNLIVRGKVAWRQLLNHLKGDHLPALHVVDLQDPKTSSRRGLVAEILGACYASPCRTRPRTW